MARALRHRAQRPRTAQGLKFTLARPVFCKFAPSAFISRAVGIDDHRRAIRDRESQSDLAKAEWRATFEAIMDTAAARLTDAIANSSAAGIYRVEVHRPSSESQVSVGIALRRGNDKQGLWGFWLSGSGTGWVNVAIGSRTGESVDYNHIKASPDLFIDRAIRGAEGRMAMDMEEHANRSGCAVGLAFFGAGILTTAGHFV